MSVEPGPADPVLPPAPHGEDFEDHAARYTAMVQRSIKVAVRRLGRLAERHGEGTLALANLGNRGVRIVYVAGDGTFGDVLVPSVAAAERVSALGGWEISGWDPHTVRRMVPSPADRRRMAGTGR